MSWFKHPKAQQWHQQWLSLPERQRRLLVILVTVLILVFIWLILLSPAFGTLKRTQQEGPKMRLELAQMEQWQQQALAMKESTPISSQSALASLRHITVRDLGTGAQVGTPSANLVTVAFQGVSAKQLSQWLYNARKGAHMVPTQAQIDQTGGSLGQPAWSGSVVMQVPNVGY